MTPQERLKRIELLKGMALYWLDVQRGRRKERTAVSEPGICAEYLLPSLKYHRGLTNTRKKPCAGCPIAEYTGQTFCCGTPYDNWLVLLEQHGKERQRSVSVREFSSKAGKSAAITFRRFIKKVIDFERKAVQNESR